MCVCLCGVFVKVVQTFVYEHLCVCICVFMYMCVHVFQAEVKEGEFLNNFFAVAKDEVDRLWTKWGKVPDENEFVSVLLSLIPSIFF